MYNPKVSCWSLFVFGDSSACFLGFFLRHLFFLLESLSTHGRRTPEIRSRRNGPHPHLPLYNVTSVGSTDPHTNRSDLYLYVPELHTKCRAWREISRSIGSFRNRPHIKKNDPHLSLEVLLSTLSNRSDLMSVQTDWLSGLGFPDIFSSCDFSATTAAARG